MPGGRQGRRQAKPERRWQKVELAWLAKHAGRKSLAELAERLRTDVSAVKAKLAELAPKTGAGKDDGLDTYQRGMEALYAQRWAEAAELLTAAVASAEYPEIAARARQFAATARARAEAEGGGDPYLEAVFEKNRGDLDRALHICRAGGRSQRDGRFAYLAAAVCALQGSLDAAADHLRRAYELDPRTRIHAVHDPDLAALRADTAYHDLFA